MSLRRLAVATSPSPSQVTLAQNTFWSAHSLDKTPLFQDLILESDRTFEAGFPWLKNFGEGVTRYGLSFPISSAPPTPIRQVTLVG